MIGEITEVASLNPDQSVRYSVETVVPQFPYTDPQPASVIIHDLQTGSTTPLGDNRGNVELEYLTERYALWDYFCLPETCQTELEFQTGLYAHKLATGEDLWIGSAGEPEAHEDWIIYVTQEQGEPAISLRVRHLATAEDFELSNQLATMQGYPIRNFYAVNQDRVVWVETDPMTQAKVLHTYDLNARTGQKLEVLAERPRALAVSDSLVIWVDTFWQAYDLRHGSLFNVPPMPMPAELWGQSPSIRVTAQDDVLQWTLDLEEGTDLYFTAQVFPPDVATQVAPPEQATATAEATPLTPDAASTASTEVPPAASTEPPPAAYP